MQTRRARTGDEQVQARQDVAGVLDELVQVAQALAALVLRDQVQLQVAQLVENEHVCEVRVSGPRAVPVGHEPRRYQPGRLAGDGVRTQLVVVLGREHAGAQLAEHVGAVLQRVHEAVLVLRTAGAPSSRNPGY